MNELKGNFKAAYDVVKRAERCVLLRSKAANPSHTYAVGDVDSNGLVFGLVLKTDPEAVFPELVALEDIQVLTRPEKHGI